MGHTQSEFRAVRFRPLEQLSEALQIEALQIEASKSLLQAQLQNMKAQNETLTPTVKVIEASILMWATLPAHASTPAPATVVGSRRRPAPPLRAPLCRRHFSPPPPSLRQYVLAPTRTPRRGSPRRTAGPTRRPPNKSR
jgi:hypothetical protein